MNPPTRKMIFGLTLWFACLLYLYSEDVYSKSAFHLIGLILSTIGGILGLIYAIRATESTPWDIK